MTSEISSNKVIILANGAFPKRPSLLEKLRTAKHLVCCDGAIQNLLDFGITPSAIIGDLDSISDEHKARFAPIITHNPDQETNDLTKAVQFCLSQGFETLEILGATGLREDHTLGNISLLANYAPLAKSVQMFTDYGVFTAISATTTFESFPNQAISIFALTPETLITTDNLEYPITNRRLLSWWEGTLNRALNTHFTITLNAGKILVFQGYR